MLVDALGGILIAAEVPAPRPVWELLLAICGGIGVVSGALLVVWKIVRPHVDRYVRSMVEPIRDNVQAVRDNVEDNSPTATEQKIDQLSNQLGRIGRKVEQIDGRTMMTRGVLDQHVAESSTWLRQTTRILRASGVQIPQWGARETEEKP